MPTGKISIQLPQAMPASNDCLPHAAMNLGAARGVGLRPVAGLVSRVVVEEHGGQWVVYRLDEGGGFVGDTWHATRDDALAHVRREFGVEMQ